MMQAYRYTRLILSTIYTATHLAGTSIHPNNDNVDVQYPLYQGEYAPPAQFAHMHESSQSIAHNLPMCMSRNPLIAQRRIFTPRGVVKPFADGDLPMVFAKLRVQTSSSD